MDIGTMQKKIRAKEYRNKTQFARDLTLIWENCLKYNADVSPGRLTPPPFPLHLLLIRPESVGTSIMTT